MGTDLVGDADALDRVHVPTGSPASSPVLSRLRTGTQMDTQESVEFKVVIPPDAEMCVVTVVGEVDLATSPELRHQLREAGKLGASQVAIDLTQTTFIDSSAVHALSEAYRSLRQRGVRMWVLCPDSAIAKLFEITAVDRLIPVYRTPDEAAAGLEETSSPAVRELVRSALRIPGHRRTRSRGS